MNSSQQNQQTRPQIRPQWSNRFTFILAATGSAIGLGNIWKFPYITGVNGGGAFVLLYLGCILLVGLPILIAELYIGQAGKKNTITSFEVLHKEKTFWRLPGWLGLISAILILSFYSVIGGWILDFEYRAIIGEFSTPDGEFIKGRLTSLFASPGRQLLWHSIFMCITLGITIGGIKDGLEKWNKILMPTLLIILLGLFLYSFTLPGFGKAITFLFSPDFSKLTSDGILEAVGHSFFTLSLGMGAILTYGSYLSEKESLPRIAVSIAFMDTIIALTAGVVIFAVVFTHDVEPGAGPGLIFSTLPLLFSQMSGGFILSIVFFLLISFAAMTSAVSMLEVIVTYLVEKQNINRRKATLLSGGGIYLLGLLTVFSTNLLSDFKILGLTFFDLFDKITSSYLLPIGGMLIALFVGWQLGQKAIKTMLKTTGIQSTIMLWCLRVVAPLAVLIILLQKIF